MLKIALASVAALALTAPAGTALAHDDDNSFSAYFDHAQHRDYHEQEAIAHAQAHEQGFSNPEEHEAWHRAAAEAHEQYHGDNPETWHDHFGYSQPYYGYGGYGQSYGGYGYRQSYRYYHPRHHAYYRSYRSYSYPYGY